MIEHDFVRYPELTDAQMQDFYFQSPHKQIFEDFDAKVVKVHDGDTVSVRWPQRRFDFPIRLANIAAPELSEGGDEAQRWLERKVLRRIVTVKINPQNRVEKWGRLLGQLILDGIDVGEDAVASGVALRWNARNEGKIPSLDWYFPKVQA